MPPALRAPWRCAKRRCAWSTTEKPAWRRSTVSLLWRNKELRLGLAPERIFVSGAKSLDLPVCDGGWQAALEALPQVLKGRTGPASLVLADQFVRYSLL